MYNSYEENSLNRRTTSVMEDERKVVNIDTQIPSQTKPSVGFTTVTKNPSRLKVTNAGSQTTEVNNVSKVKQKSKTKNVAMRAVYSIAAFALVAVIAINAIAIGSVTATNASLSAELSTLETSYSALSTELSTVSSAERVGEIASSQLDLTATTAQTASFTVPGYIATEAPAFENNWFDNILDMLA